MTFTARGKGDQNQTRTSAFFFVFHLEIKWPLRKYGRYLGWTRPEEGILIHPPSPAPQPHTQPMHNKKKRRKCNCHHLAALGNTDNSPPICPRETWNKKTGLQNTLYKGRPQASKILEYPGNGLTRLVPWCLWSRFPFHFSLTNERLGKLFLMPQFPY